MPAPQTPRLRSFLYAALLSLWATTLNLAGSHRASAQIVPDNTLGSENSQVTPLDALTDRIDGGAQRSSNLFHSFQDFNIDAGRAAYFANPAAVRNILSRVTGSNPSHLFGTLGVLGDANLYFLNPNGIIFGPDARLDLRGSFLASTADRFVLPDGSEFSAVAPQAPPLLTVDVQAPIALEFERSQTGSLIASGDLSVAPSRSLTLVGGSVIATGQLTAPSGQISLLATPGNQRVNLNPDGTILSTAPLAPSDGTIPDAPSLDDLLNSTPADLGVRSLGNNQVEFTASGSQATASPGTTLISGTLNAASLSENLGERSSGDFSITQNSKLKTQNFPYGGTLHILGDRVGLIDQASLDASGDQGGGTVLIGGDFQGKGSIPNAQQAIVGPEATIQADALNGGDGGQVIVWADGTTRFFGNISARGAIPSSIQHSTLNTQHSPSNGGFVEVSGKGNLQFQGQVDTSAPNGEPGTLLLDPDDIIVVPGFSPFTFSAFDGIWEFTEDPGMQQIGADFVSFLLNFNALTLQATNDIKVFGEISLPNTNGLTLEAGRDVYIFDNIFSRFGGMVNLVADETLVADGVGIISIPIGSTTFGGDVNLDAHTLIIANGTVVGTSTFGIGKAGNLNVNVSDSVIVSGTNAFGLPSSLVAESGGSGSGGTLTLNTRRLQVLDGGHISTDVFAGGNAGQMIINARESVNVSGTDNFGNGSFLTAQSQGNGEGGSLTLNTHQLKVLDGGTVSTSTFAAGKAGLLTINAIDSVTVSGINAAGLPSSIDSGSPGSGEGGALMLNTRQLQVLDGGIIGTNTVGVGSSGNLTVNASDSIVVSSISPLGQPSFVSTESKGSGDGGALILNTQRLEVLDGGVVSTNTFAEGNSGKLTVNASEAVIVSGNNALGNSSALAAQSSGSGEGGALTLNTHHLEILNGGLVSTNTFAEGSAGQLTVNASDSIIISGTNVLGDPSALAAQSSGSGEGGALTLNTRRLKVINGGLISTNTFAEGNAGDLKINASDLVTVRSTDAFGQASSLAAQSGGGGKGGALTVNTRKLQVLDGGLISTNAFAEGKAGDLTIHAGELVTVSSTNTLGIPSGVGAQSQGTGRGGVLTVNTRKLQVLDGGLIGTNAFAEGNAGQLNINAKESVLVKGISPFGIPSLLSAESAGSGKGGGLVINTYKLKVFEGGIVTTTAFASGQGGQLTVNASDSIIVNGTSSLGNSSSLTAESGGSGDGGGVTLNTKLLRVFDGGAISTSTFDVGKAGQLTVNAQDVITVRGVSASGTPSGLGAFSTGEGDGGTISLNTRKLQILEGGTVTTSTFAAGDGGQLIVNASESVTISGTSIVGNSSSLEAESRGHGKGGSISFNTSKLWVFDGGIVSTSAFDSGKAGQLIVNASEAINLRNNASLEAVSSGSGAAGDLILRTGELTVKDRSAVTVSSQADGLGGNLEISADNILLENQSALIAETASTDGGNIRLSVKDLLLMRHNSLISATAGGQGNGGNVEIDAAFVVAVPSENSDIIANAFEGNGGRVQITANGIFGLGFRPRLTPLSDITASSEFGTAGTVTLNTLEVDPSRGLTNLPDEPVETQVSAGCQGEGGQGTVALYDIGRGGLPPSPEDLLSGSAITAEWIESDGAAGSRDRAATSDSVHSQWLSPLCQVGGDGVREWESDGDNEGDEGDGDEVGWAAPKGGISRWGGDVGDGGDGEEAPTVIPGSAGIQKQPADVKAALAALPNASSQVSVATEERAMTMKAALAKLPDLEAPASPPEAKPPTIKDAIAALPPLNAPTRSHPQEQRPSIEASLDALPLLEAPARSHPQEQQRNIKDSLTKLHSPAPRQHWAAAL